jgi:ATP-binding cassette subfamily F protein uup
MEKMTYKEKLELETLNKEMPVMEAKKALLNEKLNDSHLKYEEILLISEELASLNHTLEAAELRWLELSEKQ